MSSTSVRLYEYIQRATASIPSPYLIPPQPGQESFSNQADVKDRYQNWAFTQGFRIFVLTYKQMSRDRIRARLENEKIVFFFGALPLCNALLQSCPCAMSLNDNALCAQCLCTMISLCNALMRCPCLKDPCKSFYILLLCYSFMLCLSLWCPYVMAF